MNAERSVLLLANRKSRRGSEQLDECQRVLTEGGLEVVHEATDAPSDIPRLIKAHKQRVSGVVVAGGDGTLNTAAAALVETALPLGILPMGTANDLARTLGIPEDPLKACEIIVHRRAHAIDLGCVNGQYFFNVAHIGLGERVSHQLSDEEKKKFGVLGYARSLVRTIREHRPFRAKVVCDGQTLRLRTIQITVGNGRHYGGGMTVHHEARIDDQRLDLYSIAPQHWTGLATLAPLLRFGRHTERNDVYTTSGRKIEIHTSRTMQIDTDGEITAVTPAYLHVVPGALQVYVPDQYLAQIKADAA